MPRSDGPSGGKGFTAIHALLIVIILLIATPLLICGGCFALFVNVLNKKEEPSVVNKADSGKPASVGDEVIANDAAVFVKDIAVESVRLRIPFSTRLEPQAEDLLRIRLTISNRSSARRLNYDSYISTLPIGTTLQDEHGNTFPLKSQWSEYDRRQSGRIEPGATITEVLLFEMPTEKSTTLFLSLSGRNIEAKTDVRFTFQRNQWAAQK